MVGRIQEMTIGELAEKAGVSLRTIRYYVTEGLLPPPSGSGKTRQYGYEHTIRLKLIKHLQAEYIPLKLIKSQIEKLSLTEMEALLKKAASKPKMADQIQEKLGPRQLLSAILSPEPRPTHRTLLRESLPPIRRLETPVPRGYWRRVPIAPGVELHYQVENDSKRDRIIGDVIDYALDRFNELDSQGDGE